MRNLSISIAAVIALAACGGPSGKDIALAKQARYQGDKLVIFNGVKSVTEAKYKIDTSDETALGLKTKPRWFTPEGLVSPGGDDNMKDTPDRSIRISLVVRLLPDGDKWIVEVIPAMERYFAGRPNTDKLDPKDPSVPGWATGQVDELQFEIHKALVQFEVKSPGGMAPPPTAAPGADKPADPPPADPNAGPAAAPAPAPAP
jgi:hypothetical protein